MRRHFKAAIAGLAFAGAAAGAIPANAQQFGIGVGPGGGVSFSYNSGGYCDDYGCPDDFWDMPVYYGPVFVQGSWFNGPLYYRDWSGGREYWIHGRWHRDEWRGPRPGFARDGRYGPPLGMDFYRAHGFHGRWDHDRGPGFGPRPDDRRDFRPRPDDRRDFGPRPDDRGPPGGYRGDNRRNYGPGPDRRDFGPGRNGPPAAAPNNGGPTPAAAPAAAPAPAGAAPAAAPANGDHRGRGDSPQP